MHLQTDLAQNGDIAENETLKNLWQWLYLSRSLVEDNTIQSFDNNQYPGVRYNYSVSPTIIYMYI